MLLLLVSLQSSELVSQDGRYIRSVQGHGRDHHGDRKGVGCGESQSHRQNCSWESRVADLATTAAQFPVALDGTAAQKPQSQALQSLPLLSLCSPCMSLSSHDSLSTIFFFLILL